MKVRNKYNHQGREKEGEEERTENLGRSIAAN